MSAAPEYAFEGEVLPDDLDISPGRRRLFEAAVRLFGSRGYHAVSVRDLAKELGVVPGAIYAHVASKQELLVEVVRLGHTVHRDVLQEALLDAGADPVDQVRAVVRAHVAIHLRYAALARVTNRELRALSPDGLAAVLAVREESERLFLEVIKRGVRLGAFSVENPQLAMLAVGAMGNRAAEWQGHFGLPSEGEIADTFADYALKLLGWRQP